MPNALAAIGAVGIAHLDRARPSMRGSSSRLPSAAIRANSGSVSGSPFAPTNAITLAASPYSGSAATAAHSCTLRTRWSSTMSRTIRIRRRSRCLVIHARKVPTRGEPRSRPSTVAVACRSIPLKFRQVLGHFPTGVTVVTATTADGTPVGFTIGSFTSVSLDPPLVGFLPMVNSDRWAAINATGSFCVNVLGRTTRPSCAGSSRRAASIDPFDGVAWQPSPITGSPIIDGAIAWIDCAIEGVVDAGDHHFVLGRVLELEHVDPDEPTPTRCSSIRGKLGEFQPHV